ncbi:MAG: hypothetical protein AAFY07_00950 [Pseudomonadota bacterium]
MTIRGMEGVRAIRLVSAILGLLMAATAQAQDNPDTRNFAQRVIAQMEQAMPGGSFTSEPGDPLQVNALDAPGMEEGIVNLHRFYKYCQTASREDCAAQIDRLLAGLVQAQDDPQLNDLRVIVRDRQYWEAIKEALKQAGGLPLHRQIGEDLFALVALDTPDSIVIATSAHLADLGLNADRAWELAAEKTSAAIPQLPSAQDLQSDLLVYEGDAYMGSLLFDLDAWQTVSAAAGPDLMVTITSDSFVVVGLLPDGENLEGFKQAVREDCAAAPRCISPNIYRYRDGGWVIAR